MENINIEEKRTETTAGEIFHRVDTTKTEGVEITYTKTEFFPPEPDKQETKPGTAVTGGPSNPVADTPKNRAKEPREKRHPRYREARSYLKYRELRDETKERSVRGYAGRTKGSAPVLTGAGS